MATTRHHTHIDLERLTGIRERRVSVGEEDSYSLAMAAALDALERAQRDAASVDVVISCSITKLRYAMGTVIEQIALTDGGWRTHHSALRVAVNAAKHCLHEAGRNANDVDLLINAGIYRDRNLAEPALAALIQEDIGANPEDPHEQAHGTFSFDISNGSCGVLTALQVVDGFLKSHAIDLALVVASDADPGRGMSEDFPFSHSGTAFLCDWSDDDRGLESIHWINMPDDGDSFSATVGLVDGRNVLRFAATENADEQFAEAAAQAAETCLRASALTLDDIDAIVAAPASSKFRAALSTRIGFSETQIIVDEDQRSHTTSLVAALDSASRQIRPGGRVLLVAAGAGITAGAALYRMPD
jgi:3-oxoacyl-[acyl-carrier-protein] synthase-3